ncbi:ribosome small subunit-dependent GTPase A [bacterium]|nr:ribosome small subunit-dependent GTPase A [bacterium]
MIILMKGQVFKIHSDFYYVNFDNKIYECKLREILKKQKSKILTGDFVEFENGAITKILPRSNFLTRPSVANITQIVIVSAVKEPDLDFEQLDRYICFAKYHNIKTKLCFNKNDLSQDDKIIEQVFSVYEPLGFDIIFTSALEKIGTEDFKEILTNETTVFCGNSGVGKSSLINAIFPNLNLKTNEVSEKTHRGTHTTRHCEIFEKDNIRIIDTPGFSNLKFDFITPQTLTTLFDDINKYAKHCKFADCTHTKENGCEVLNNSDKIAPSRFQSYKSFFKESQEFKEKIKFESKKKESSQKISQNKNLAKISIQKRQSSRNNLRQQIYNEINNGEEE